MAAAVVMEGRKKKTVKDGSASIKCENPMLTPAQFSEFQRQVLIFEHMKAGLPVPCHVLMPMWREVASSFGSDPSSVYNLYPSRKYFTLLIFFKDGSFDMKNTNGMRLA